MKDTWSWLLVLGLAGGCAGTKPVREPSPLPANASEQAFEVVPLKHASAVELAPTLRILMDECQWAIAHRNRYRIPKLDVWSERYFSDEGPEGVPWRVVAYPRTNSIVFSSSDPEDLPRLRELIAKLDVSMPSAHSQSPGGGLDPAGCVVEVVPIRYSSAVEIASTLNGLLEASRRAVRHRGCALPKQGMENEMYRDDL